MSKNDISKSGNTRDVDILCFQTIFKNSFLCGDSHQKRHPRLEVNIATLCHCFTTQDTYKKSKWKRKHQVMLYKELVLISLDVIELDRPITFTHVQNSLSVALHIAMGLKWNLHFSGTCTDKHDVLQWQSWLWQENVIKCQHGWYLIDKSRVENVLQQIGN